MASFTLHIQGMSCGHCLNAVNNALRGVPGARVDTVQIGRAEVEVTPPATAQDLVAAVADAGYAATAVVRE